MYARWRIFKSHDLAHEVTLVFNGDEDVVCCKTVNEMIFLMQTITLCELVPIDSVKRTALSLMRIREEIVNKLQGSFSMDEINRCSTGGWPSAKEITLYLLIRKYRPSLVVETGVAQGVSSRFILEAIKENGTGKLISIDLPNYDPNGYIYSNDKKTADPVYVKRTLGTGWLVDESLRHNWQLILMSSGEALPEIRGPIDMFFHDSEHSFENMMFEFEWAKEHLNNGGFIVSDDINWNDAFYQFSEKHSNEFEIWNEKGPGVLRKLHAQ